MKIIFSEPISTAWKINFLSLIVGFYWRMTCNRGLESENLDDSMQVFLDMPSPSTTVNVKLIKLLTEQIFFFFPSRGSWYSSSQIITWLFPFY